MHLLSRLAQAPANLPAQSGRGLTILLIALTVLFTFFVLGSIIYLCVKYHRGTLADRSNPPTFNRKLEALWIGAPLVLGLCTYSWSASLYMRMFEPPADAEQIYVLGKQWMWKLYRPDGPSEIDELHLLKDKPVLLLLTSQDVIHDFSIPDFRVKMDVLPGSFTQLWFQPTRAGTFWVFCAQYCGTNHDVMRAKVIVMERPEYDAWLNGKSELRHNLVEQGEATFKRLGCEGCHTLYSRGTAPSLYNLSGRTESLDSGEDALVDENYLRESLLAPAAKIVRGYPPVMPAYKGRVSEEELLGLIAYIKSLKTPG